MDPVIKAAYDASLKGQSFAIATIVGSSEHGTPRKSGAKMVVLTDGTIYGTIGGGKSELEISALCRKAIKDNQSRMLDYKFSGIQGQPICGGKVKIYIEPIQGQRQLVICGAGHIALPLSVIGKILNFSVIIIDDRKELANRKRFPHVDQILCGNHKKQLTKIEKNTNTFVVIITQDHKKDFVCLTETLATPVQYIGVIGSRVKKEHFLTKLRQKRGLDKINMPVGLALGGETPEEIAISIMAEIISKYQINKIKGRTSIDKRRSCRSY